MVVEGGIAGLVAELHGDALRCVAAHLGEHVQGLSEGARRGRRRGLLSNRLARRLERLDVCFGILRHLTKPLYHTIMSELKAELENNSCAFAPGVEVRTDSPEGRISSEHTGPVAVAPHSSMQVPEISETVSGSDAMTQNMEAFSSTVAAGSGSTGAQTMEMAVSTVVTATRRRSRSPLRPTASERCEDASTTEVIPTGMALHESADMPGHVARMVTMLEGSAGGININAAGTEWLRWMSSGGRFGDAAASADHSGGGGNP